MAKSSSKKPAAKKQVAKKAAAKSKATGKTAVKKNANPLSHIRHYDFSVNEPFKYKTAKKKFEVPERFRGAPADLAVTFEPIDNNSLVYHPTPGFTSLERRLAQFSVAALLYNKGSKTVDLDKVVITYKLGISTIKKEVFLPSDQLVIAPGYAWWWQNSRPYHENGDVVFLSAPFPTSATISFHFKGYTTPLSFVKNLKPYNGSLSLPFKKSDFGTNEHVTGYSMHGGGDQVFAYDLGAQAYVSNAWTGLHPGKAGDKNEHHRIWGKSLYAMADGVILHFENNIPNNVKLDGSEENMKKQQDEFWGAFDYGHCGNHFYIRHGNVVAVYAHMQKGSLNASFMQVGKTIKKGDYLGKAGNSGNSTGPHVHLHIKTYKNDKEPEGGIFRPLLFNNGYVIGTANYPKPQSNVNWSRMDAEGIPGLKNKACFVHPSDTHPYCAYPTNWGEVCRFGVAEALYQQEFDKVWTCGYYPVWVDGYQVAGKTYFNVIYRPSKNIQWVARHGMTGAGYQKEFDKWGKAGYRLININSYISGGQIRYAAVWIRDNSLGWFAYHGWSLAAHEAKFEEYFKAGWVPANVSCVDVGGKIYVTALWEKKNTGGFYLRPVMSLQEFVAFFNEYTNQKKYKLVYLDAYMRNGKPMLSGIWYKNQSNFNSWYEKYNLTASQFQSEYNSMLQNGFLTRCIAGYSQGSSARFEGIWSK